MTSIAEGEIHEEGGKKFIWTKRIIDATCTIYEWVEEIPPPIFTFDYTAYGVG